MIDCLGPVISTFKQDPYSLLREKEEKEAKDTTTTTTTTTTNVKDEEKGKLDRAHLASILRANAHGPDFKQYSHVCMYR